MKLTKETILSLARHHAIDHECWSETRVLSFADALLQSHLSTEGVAHSAIESAIQVLRQVEAGDGVFVGQCSDAIAGLEAALATEGGEAVAWLFECGSHRSVSLTWIDPALVAKGNKVTPLYAAHQSKVDSGGVKPQEEIDADFARGYQEALQDISARESAAPQSQVDSGERKTVEQARDRILGQTKNSLFRSGVKVMAAEILSPAEQCNKPPEGWSCSRIKGHEGPCAAIPQSQGEKAVASEDAADDDVLERFNAATSLNALYAEEIRNLRELLGELAKLRRYDPNNGKRKEPYLVRNLTLNVPAEMFNRIDAAAAAIAGEKKA
ncbi:hypothetical protein [Caballeronia sp. LZ034LL]|uniref:hypothetical protein n=1 Tax=Caballeronia sp. LZ034LL TaxID=3038567 RepID=UPI0028575683|nr:hypothetical protein [Caballeronia sp. LZ034LL]MDR5839372.1 hypothetical protein [Caballeronia sp. LZ034LL]